MNPHNITLDTEIQYLKGVGPQRAKLLEKLNIYTVEDILYFFPRAYEDRSNFERISNLKPNNIYTLKVKIVSVSERTVRRNLSLLSVKVTDGYGFLSIVFFNQKYLKKYFKSGTECLFSGKIDYNRGLQMVNPSYEFLVGDKEDLLHTGRIVPIYNLTNGITQRILRNIVKNSLDLCLVQVKEVINQRLIEKYSFLNKKDAIFNIHFPLNEKVNLEARKRLIFEEFFVLQTGLAMRSKRQEARSKEQERRGMEQVANLSFSAKAGNPCNRLDPPDKPEDDGKGWIPGQARDDKIGTQYDDRLTSFENILPFNLTNAQKRVIDEIAKDMVSDKAMHRLLQGDVGSGKTIVAVFALLFAAKNGYQGVLMAPTEILAEQHYLIIKKLIEKLDIKITFLVGGQTKKEKTEIIEKVKTGFYNIVIGTHALLEDWVEFKNLGLAVIDEQHKFGVAQRAKLKNKGHEPNVLIMTATPIPRTLTMTIYGDLDVSIIDELPGGRKPIKTFVIGENKKTRMYNFIKDEINKGRQIYFVYPLIEESEKMDLKAAMTFYEHLSTDIFSDFKLLLMHGRMSGKEKDNIMTCFKKKEADILVATTVIEVGIDVPNASIMVIENAERFGLSQLHQIRGRVGRGEHQSYCILVTVPKTEESKKRMQVMTETCDGFKIAEQDLEIRGPGDFFGFRQHGMPELRIGSLIEDIKVMETARTEAFEIVNKWHSHSEDKIILNLLNYVKKRYQDKIDFAGIG